MRNVRLVCLGVTLLASALAHAQAFDPLTFDWQAADRATVRLAPDRFPQLPRRVRTYLAAHGFTVPQSSISPEPHNVIRGHFRGADTMDWAVLASKDRVSRVLVFLSGSTHNPAALDEKPDLNFLQGPGVFSRQIRSASPKIILGYRAAYGDHDVPISHDGIEDYFVDKASSIHYFHSGQWLSLTGAD